MPNTINRYLRGNDRGYSDQTLPQLWGKMPSWVWANVSYAPEGCIYHAEYYNQQIEGGKAGFQSQPKFEFNAQRYNGTFGAFNKNGETGYVMPYTTHCFFIIKY